MRDDANRLKSRGQDVPISLQGIVRGTLHVQVRIRADPSFTKWDVEIAAPPTFSRVHKLAPLFGIIFRRSSCQHPVLAGALG